MHFCPHLCLFSFLGQGLTVADQRWGAFNALRQLVLLYVAGYFFVEILIEIEFLLLHALADVGDAGIVLHRGGGLLNLLITALSQGRGVRTLLHQGGVDHLVLLIHVSS